MSQLHQFLSLTNYFEICHFSSKKQYNNIKICFKSLCLWKKPHHNPLGTFNHLSNIGTDSEERLCFILCYEESETSKFPKNDTSLWRLKCVQHYMGLSNARGRIKTNRICHCDAHEKIKQFPAQGYCAVASVLTRVFFIN
jgi:hypothetical protein